MYCRECGEELEVNGRYCPHCGTDLNTPDTGMDSATSTRLAEEEPDETQIESDTTNISSAPLSNYWRPTQRYFWLALFSAWAFLTTSLLWASLWSLGTNSTLLLLLSWASYAALVLSIYFDVRLLRRYDEWTPPFGMLIGLAIPYVNIILGFNYCYDRHRRTVDAEPNFLSYSAYLIAGVVTAALSLTVYPVVFGPLSVLAGYKIQSNWDRGQGAFMMVFGMICAVGGFWLGIALPAG